MQDPPDSLIGQFHAIADKLLSRDRARHSIGPGDLVNTVLERLYRLGQDEGLSRTEVLARVVRMMRQRLVDRARRRNSVKRGQGRVPVQLDPEFEGKRGLGPLGTLEVHEALETLEALNPRQAQVVELRFFGGLTLEEIAEALDCSERTVGTDWRLACAWLKQQFAGDANG
jgi:RNA polymerase sigma factor (TIGR02999 family)